MFTTVFRTVANVIIVVGLCLLAKVLYNAATGSLATRFFAQSPGSRLDTVYALGLALPIPFHVILIGLIVQKRWLSPRWAKIAWFAVIISGCWLGASLAIRLVIS